MAKMEGFRFNRWDFWRREGGVMDWEVLIGRGRKSVKWLEMGLLEIIMLDVSGVYLFVENN